MMGDPFLSITPRVKSKVDVRKLALLGTVLGLNNKLLQERLVISLATQFPPNLSRLLVYFFIVCSIC